MNTEQLAIQYQQELLQNVLPFWQNHSKDETHGGYFTCLLQDGQIFDTDKFIWLQARQVWTFTMLYNRLEQRQEWLNFALYGADFLEKYGRDEQGNWYFSLTQKGSALIQPYNIFSDCFATMAFGQLYQATQQEKHAEIAKTTFQNILQRQANPKGKYNKAVSQTRPLKNFALPMILCNLCLEIEELLEVGLVEQTIQNCIREVMEVFYDGKRGVILENVSPKGEFSDTFDGRLLNPGHAIEAMWFVMDLGQRLNDQQLIEQATERCVKMLELGWDEQYGGIFYFLDTKGYPTQQLEWDQKLWWVHLETLVALLKGFQLTQNELCWHWFERVHSYTWSHFRDQEQGGEWFGYLNRRGERLLDLKGGKWKGCFHVPRALLQCHQVLKAIDEH
ncbi:MAG: AGE family epimerase/isomerase [Bacteroidota bacterium]